MNIPPHVKIDITNGRFQVGDRVTRPEDVFVQNSPLMKGTVTRTYTKHTYYPESEIDWFYPELYEVQWDNGKVGLGYLPHGIDRA